MKTVTDKKEVIVEKKPPIPTANRLNNPNRTNIIPKFIPPRNKN